MMDGNHHSWSKEFINNNASGHWLISDNSLSKVEKYGVLSGLNVESLQYQGFGERVDVVKSSDAERPISGAGLIDGRCKYVTFDCVNDRIKCNMNLNITSGDETFFYSITAYSKGNGLKNSLIGHNNAGWDHFIE